MHNTIKLIALDLDGTLLNSSKELTRANITALEKAANAGVWIVPTTGRFYDAMPPELRALPFIRYAITINGAEVLDVKTGEVIYKAEMTWQQAVQMMELMDALPSVGIYDCYYKSHSYMSLPMKARINDAIENPHYQRMFHELRRFIPDLKQFLTQEKQNVQKVQYYTRDEQMCARLREELPRKFEHIAVTSSLTTNVEINQEDANKGKALLALARHLGLGSENTMAFGDGLNDLSMLRAAGIGVAMGNACPEALAAADYVTASNDEDGVARGVEKFCFGA